VGEDLTKQSTDSRMGVIAGLAAYGLWGLMPLYFHALAAISADEILAQRIVWCALFLALILTITQRWPELARGLRSPKVVGTFTLTSLLLSVNWLSYIYGIVTKQAIETSLGYFINPLLNVAFGVLFFRERLRPMQLAAVGLALAGVLNLVVTAGYVPWIALSIAVSFALYGLFRKTAPADAFLGLAYETFILLIPACAYTGFLVWAGRLQLGAIDRQTDCLLLASGVITAVPLLFFGVAARNVSLSTLGFIQYIAPSIQFLLATMVLGEPMDDVKWRSFAAIWTALAVYSFDTWRAIRQPKFTTKRPLPSDAFVSRHGADSCSR
jgi:chloramphenicol-sensitive protein RarD